MTTETEAISDDALADVAYLSRSRNRITILEALRSGPHPSGRLEERTQASRSTLERILTELEERGWAERSPDGYVTTPVGERVIGEFRPVVTAMGSIRTLGEAVAWLPDEELSIGLHHFDDATVRRTTPNSPMAEATYLLELMREASVFRTLTYIAPPLSLLQSMRDSVVEGRMTATNVLTDDLVGYLRERPEQTPYWREYVEAGARIYCYRGHIPCNVFVVDETVLIANNDPDSGHPCEFIETTDETVRSWGRELIETYRRNSERLTPETFTEESRMSAEHTS
ncbi:helix-turn-helix transcriptional regulator [Halorussus aquaticus]|uniref:Helix-turn-helix transcriptional regulator n=1 Tax=Halorussus aquaticus TaxID=2953748 RepID=A0ABD5PWZ7_9EURY|nr:helix-turn-helix domain-containing protein [Halorussus aquaticus]